MDDRKSLTTQDIEDLLAEGDKFKKLPSFRFLGKDWDIQSAIIFFISIIIWFAIWGIFKIEFKTIPYGIYFLIFYVLISFVNLYNSASDVSDAESERMNQATQASFIQGGIAVFILAFVFLYNIKMEEPDRIKIYTVLVLSLLVSCLGIIIINVRNESSNIRTVRKMQQAFFNQGLILFMLGLYMIYSVKSKIS